MEKKRKFNLKDFIKNNKKLVIIALIAIVVIIVSSITLAIYCEGHKKDLATKTEEGISANTSPGIVKDEEYEGLKFTNTTLIKDNGIYTLSMSVINTTDEVSKIRAVNIPIKDKNGRELIVLLGYIGKDLEPNETITITASASADLSKAKDKEITEKK